MIPLAAQPAEKGALEQLGVEPVGLGPPVLPRHRHARGMNDVRLDAARSQPARQPEAVAAGLEGDGDALDLVASLLRFLRHRSSSFNKAFSSASSFFNGWRSTPGTIPATSQLFWLISITAINV